MDLPDDTLGVPGDLKEGHFDTLRLPDDLKEGPGDVLEPLDDLEEGFDDILELPDDLPDDATSGLAGDLGDDLLEECFAELLASLFFCPPCTGCTTISLALIQHRAVSNLLCQTLHILSFFRFLSLFGSIFYPEVCFFMLFKFACYPLVDVLLLLTFKLL